MVQQAMRCKVVRVWDKEAEAVARAASLVMAALLEIVAQVETVEVS